MSRCVERVEAMTLVGDSTGWDAAVREAEDEAGLLGELTRRPIGRFRYSKQDECYDLRVYVMRVMMVLDAWLEAAHRRRRCMAVGRAVKRLRPKLHGFVHETVRIARSPTRCQQAPAAAHRTASLGGL